MKCTSKKFKKRKSSSYERISKEIPLRENRPKQLIVFSLKDFDKNQGQSFDEWQEDKLLALAFTKLCEVSNLTKVEALSQQIIKEYPKGVFPPNSDFSHPKHVDLDISWCTFHIQGKECVIGYFIESTFYIVFLDKNHSFWITEKKHT